MPERTLDEPAGLAGSGSPEAIPTRGDAIFEKFTRATVREFQNQLRDVLNEFGKQHGLVIEIDDRVTFDATSVLQGEGPN